MEENPEQIKSAPKKYTTVLITLILIGSVFYSGYSFGQNSKSEISTNSSILNKNLGQDQNVDFSVFWKAWSILNTKFVSVKGATTTDQDRVWGAIEGLTSSFKDPYTVFMPPETAKEFQSEISGTFEGVGMELGIKDNTLTVVAPLKDTPADKAGIKSGDKILKIDKTVTTNMATDQAVKLIRGPRGTTVNLLIGRDGVKEPITIVLTRDIINIPTIDTEIKQGNGMASSTASSSGSGLQKNGIFVIRLYSFSATSPNLFRNALRKFIETGSDKLILDLRNNPGGYLDAAVDMASWFLPAGKVVVQEDFGKNNGGTTYYRSKGYNIFTKDLKMVILVNEGSASASEILSGALEEYGIAKLVGTQTFGKGSVQELIDLTPDTSLKVTIARWLTPNGRSISEVGIAPDVQIKITQKDLDTKRDPQMDKAIQMLTSM